MANEETRRDADETLDAILREIDATPKKSATKTAERPARTEEPQRRRPSGQRPAPQRADGERAPRTRRPAARPMETETVGAPRRSSAQRASGERMQRPDGTRTQRPAGTRTQRPEGTRAQRPEGTRAQRPEGTHTQRPTGERAAQPQRDAAPQRRRPAAAEAARRPERDAKRPAAAARTASGTKRAAAVKKRNPHAFRIGMLIYVIIFLLVAMFLMHKLWSFLGEYEASRPQYTIDGYVAALNSGFYNDMVRQKVEEMEVSPYENAEVISETLDLESLDGQTYTWMKKADEYTDENPVYYIRYGNAAIATVTLTRAGGTEQFDLPVWQACPPVSLIEMASEPEYDLEVTVPEGTSVTINGFTVPQADMEVCDANVVLDDAALVYAKQPGAMKVTVSGLYVAPKVQAYDVQGNMLAAMNTPEASDKNQVYIFEPKDEAAPDPQFIAHTEEMMRAYINYTANKDEQVWTNLGYLDNFLVPNGNAYQMLHSMVMDFNWNNPYTARVDRELTISHVKMYSDSVCTCEAYFNYQLTKNVVNDYIGTIRWTMVKVGNTWLATDFVQLSDESANTAVLATPNYTNENNDADDADDEDDADDAATPVDATADPADPNATTDPAVTTEPTDPNAVTDPVV